MIPISFAARDNKVGCKLSPHNGAFRFDEMDANFSREQNQSISKGTRLSFPIGFCMIF